MNAFAGSTWRLAHGRSVELGPRGVLMGILNVTPDSFSDGGRHVDVGTAVVAAVGMVAAGATIIDVGGESTRPGAEPVPSDVEIDRVVPVIAALAKRTDALISVDTYRAATARAAARAGAHIVNDVTGTLGDDGMIEAVLEEGVGLVLMHNARPTFAAPLVGDPVQRLLSFRGDMMNVLERRGVARDRVVFDPGIGFGKEAAENLVLLKRLEELCDGFVPLLLGTSRKRFVGSVTGRENAAARDVGTAITTAFGRRAGAAVFRVHDVDSNRDALLMAEALA